MKNNIDTLNRPLPTTLPATFPLEMELPKIIEENVGNFCPVCGKIIFSNLLEIDGKVYLEKNCCTRELVFIENDVDFFKKYRNNTKDKMLVSCPKNFQEYSSENPNYGTSTVIIFSNTKCNQDCPVCYQKHIKYPNEDLEAPLEEIKKGVEKCNSREVLMSGGEPTVRKDLLEIIRVIKDSGNIPGIYTNGLKLTDKDYLKKLKKAGLSIIGLQFDGFNRAANIRFRGQDYLERRLKVLENIKEVGGLKVELMPIIERGLNEAEMSKIIQFGLENELINKINFSGLLPPPGENTIPTTCSDLIKIMEKEGYFDREYYLELVKMYRNIYDITRKIVGGTPSEGWFFERLYGFFNVVHFKRKTNPPQLLFQKQEIEKINKILEAAMNKKSRSASLCVLLRNSAELIKSPLNVIFREKFFLFKRKTTPSNKLLAVNFQQLGGMTNRILKTGRASSIILTSIAAFTYVTS